MLNPGGARFEFDNREDLQISTYCNSCDEIKMLKHIDKNPNHQANEPSA